MALNEIQEINGACGESPTLIELDVEACYPSIKHDTVNRAFFYFFEYVPDHLITVYVNIWARTLYLLDHTYIQVDGVVYQQKSGLSQGSAATPFLADFSLFMIDSSTVPNSLTPGMVVTLTIFLLLFHLTKMSIILPPSLNNSSLMNSKKTRRKRWLCSMAWL